MSALLTATALQVRYNEQVVLNRASLTINERDRIGMVGRNGPGKSTFLKIIASVQPPDAGEVTQHRDIVIGYLPQSFALDPASTPGENIRADAGHALRVLH